VPCLPSVPRHRVKFLMGGVARRVSKKKLGV
jgi:hypothetical protein